MRVGDYLLYTRARAVDISDDPLWLVITGEPTDRGIPVRYCCGGHWHGEYSRTLEWTAMHQRDVGQEMISYSVVKKEDLPDEFYVQMAKFALLGSADNEQ